MRQAPPRCSDCGVAIIDRRSQRCTSCAYLARRKLTPPTCEQCGAVVGRRDTKLCASCYHGRGKEARTCPDCKGPKLSRSMRCQDCLAVSYGRTGQRQLRSLVARYRGAEMARQFGRSELDWSVPEVAARSGVHVGTIRSWINGTREPHRFELEAVMRVLTFDLCGNCRGLGYIDPSERQHRKERSA